MPRERAFELEACIADVAQALAGSRATFSASPSYHRQIVFFAGFTCHSSMWVRRPPARQGLTISDNHERIVA